jgi:hypothetical protein
MDTESRLMRHRGQIEAPNTNVHHRCRIATVRSSPLLALQIHPLQPAGDTSQPRPRFPPLQPFRQGLFFCADAKKNPGRWSASRGFPFERLLVNGHARTVLQLLNNAEPVSKRSIALLGNEIPLDASNRPGACV